MIRAQCVGEDGMGGSFMLPAGCGGFALLSNKAGCAAARSVAGRSVK